VRSRNSDSRMEGKFGFLDLTPVMKGRPMPLALPGLGFQQTQGCRTQRFESQSLQCEMSPFNPKEIAPLKRQRRYRWPTGGNAAS
jgi:hypothetical protein